MKIVILFLGRNGAGPKYAFQMAKELVLYSENKYQVIVPNNIDNADEWMELEKSTENMEIHFVKFYSNFKEFIFKFLNIAYLKNIANLVRVFNPNWIYMPMGSLLNPGIFLFLKKYKKVYTIHDPILHVGERNFFLELLKSNEIKSSEKIVILNNFFKKIVMENYHISSKNIGIIPHAGFFKTVEPTYNDDFYYKILFLGRIEKYKGIEILLEAMENLVDDHKKIRLTIAGKGDLSQYFQKIKLLGDRIIVNNEWLTEVQIENLLNDHDFVVLPYIDASQSGVIPLAFGNGKMVIATNVGALSEQVPPNLGLTINPNSIDLKNAILELYAIPYNTFIEKSKNAYFYAKQNLTWKSSAEKLLNFINNK